MKNLAIFVLGVALSFGVGLTAGKHCPWFEQTCKTSCCCPCGPKCDCENCDCCKACPGHKK